ncbi:peptidylprolyl isomerase [Aliiroseovarius sp. KMU-50]|uniref:Peptidyl-prolyl cis-trans isomerase n=1 Tax=Aliiroseovarius salicola TaxID=3009082 RepID=A0ABT4W1N5_9RHOB|nr:peptidylprolyl isomerase [Aliiroseovarius sp. KMU-50]MDA5094424.1 peptidylprolyl isomerase [Aliiroseovarius sp. KMU-50]
MSDYTKKEARGFWMAFAAGVMVMVGYAVYTLWPQTFEPNAAIAEGDFPKIEITVEGEANGQVEITLRPDLAPLHVERILTLSREGAYDGVVFHRVIDGFMAQTGDVQYGKMGGGKMDYAGMGGSDYPDLPAEFSDETFATGIVGMARSQNPNSGNSQFFIMFAPGTFLDRQYTIVGEVTKGFEVVQEIKKGAGPNGQIIGDPDVMKTVKAVE